MSDQQKSNTTLNTKPDAEPKKAFKTSQLGSAISNLKKYRMVYKGTKDTVFYASENSMASYVLLHEEHDSYSKTIYYISNEDVAEELYTLGADVKFGEFILYRTRDNVEGVDFIPDSDDSWTRSRLNAVLAATKTWVMMRSPQNNEQEYIFREFPPSIAKMQPWPDDIDELFASIMSRNTIDSMDHPIAKRIAGNLFGINDTLAATTLSQTEEGGGILDD